MFQPGTKSTNLFLQNKPQGGFQKRPRFDGSSNNNLFNSSTPSSFNANSNNNTSGFSSGLFKKQKYSQPQPLTTQQKGVSFKRDEFRFRNQMNKPQNLYEVVSVGAKREDFQNSYQYPNQMMCLNAYGGKDISSHRQYINDVLSQSDNGKNRGGMNQQNNQSKNFSFGKQWDSMSRTGGGGGGGGGNAYSGLFQKKSDNASLFSRPSGSSANLFTKSGVRDEYVPGGKGEQPSFLTKKAGDYSFKPTSNFREGSGGNNPLASKPNNTSLFNKTDNSSSNAWGRTSGSGGQVSRPLFGQSERPNLFSSNQQASSNNMFSTQPQQDNSLFQSQNRPYESSKSLFQPKNNTLQNKPASTLSSLIRLNAEKNQIMNKNTFTVPKKQHDKEVWAIQNTLKDMVYQNQQQKLLSQSNDDKIANKLSKVMQKNKIPSAFEIQEMLNEENQFFHQNLSNVAKNVIKPEHDDLLIHQFGSELDRKDFKQNFMESFKNSFGLKETFPRHLFENNQQIQPNQAVERQKNPLHNGQLEIQPKKTKKLVWQLTELDIQQIQNDPNEDEKLIDMLQQIEQREEREQMFRFKQIIKPHCGTAQYNQVQQHPQQQHHSSDKKKVKLGADVVSLKIEVILDKRLLQTFDICASPDSTIEAIERSIVKRIQNFIQLKEQDTIIMFNMRRILPGNKSLHELNIHDGNQIIEFNICSKKDSYEDLNKMLYGNDYEGNQDYSSYQRSQDKTDRENEEDEDEEVNHEAVTKKILGDYNSYEEEEEQEFEDDQTKAYKPILSDKFIYYPPKNNIMKMTQKQLRKVRLIITNPNFGRIEFLEPVDLTYVNIDQCVDIGEGWIQVYNDDFFGQNKPLPGQKLNQPACLIYFLDVDEDISREVFRANVMENVGKYDNVKLMDIDTESMTVQYEVHEW